ncbi:MAG: hypothetical protein K2R93_12320 [Gemmatimonadaceae bacterium]|nr:hypothetical protein [Gemmatimonadaceae bacterium]
MRITQGDHAATFTPGEGYTSENDSFALWLSTAFPEPTAEDLREHGLTVDGIGPVSDEPALVITHDDA